MRIVRLFGIVVLLAVGTVLLPGCPSGGFGSGLVTDCFGDETISESEFDDLIVFERVLYEKNDCGRYEPISSVLDDVLD